MRHCFCPSSLLCGLRYRLIKMDLCADVLLWVRADLCGLKSVWVCYGLCNELRSQICSYKKGESYFASLFINSFFSLRVSIWNADLCALWRVIDSSGVGGQSDSPPPELTLWPRLLQDIQLVLSAYSPDGVELWPPSPSSPALWSPPIPCGAPWSSATTHINLLNDPGRKRINTHFQGAAWSLNVVEDGCSALTFWPPPFRSSLL